MQKEELSLRHCKEGYNAIPHPKDVMLILEVQKERRNTIDCPALQ
jgi:hypothetical protein